MGMKWRSDIDGLRAFAVVAVIVNHSDPNALYHGYLGVDVFFVISGYVIALSLFGTVDMPLGKFLVSFYARRVKRLFPALMLCVAASSVVLLTIDPDPNVSLRTGATALLGFSNIFLYLSQLDYFAADVSFNAFTHTWSLGIEEQFYLLLPALIWLVVRSGASGTKALRLPWTIGILSLASFGLFLIYRDSHPIASFYLLHTRLWELGAGVFLAIFLHRRSATVAHADGPTRVIGVQSIFIVLLVAAFAVRGTGTTLIMIHTVVLTGLIIATSDRSWLVQNPVSIYLGKISYSLYLWHWPLLVFERLQPNAVWTQPIPLLALLLAASMFSYHVVEQPLRQRIWFKGHRFAPAYCVAACVAAFGLLAFLSAPTGLAPVSPTTRTVAAQSGEISLETPFLELPSGDPYIPTCVVDDQGRNLEIDTFARCTFSPAPGSDAPTIWVIGDSHAGHFQGLLVKLHEELGFGFHLVETPGRAFPSPPGTDETSRVALMNEMRENLRPGDVILLGRLYFSRTTPPTVSEGLGQYWEDALEDFIEEMAARAVTVIVPGPPPMYDFVDIRGCDRQDPSSCSAERVVLVPLVDHVEGKLDAVARRHENMKMLRVFDTLCPRGDQVCTPVKNGVFTMRDRDHLNAYGAYLLRDPILDLIDY